MNELTPEQLNRIWDKYSTVLLEHDRTRRDCFFVALGLLALAFLVWRWM